MFIHKKLAGIPALANTFKLLANYNIFLNSSASAWVITSTNLSSERNLFRDGRIHLKLNSEPLTTDHRTYVYVIASNEPEPKNKLECNDDAHDYQPRQHHSTIALSEAKHKKHRQRKDSQEEDDEEPSPVLHCCNKNKVILYLPFKLI